MKLYDFGQAPNPRRLRIVLAEKGIKVPTEPVDIGSLQIVFQHLHPYMKRMVEPQVAAWGEANKPRIFEFLQFLDSELGGRPDVRQQRGSRSWSPRAKSV